MNANNKKVTIFSKQNFQVESPYTWETCQRRPSVALDPTDHSKTTAEFLLTKDVRKNDAPFKKASDKICVYI